VALLLNTQNLAKSYGADPLFRNLSLNLSEGDRLGLVGSNGSGKSTLLEILAGRRQPDAGEVAFRKNTRVRYVSQDSSFARGKSVREVIRRALDQSTIADNEAAENEKHTREAETLGRAGFTRLRPGNHGAVRRMSQ
jgi:ABC transport system ATP-binding/permease protein